MAFGQKNLLPSCINLFIADVALHWFIHFKHPASVLSYHAETGAHTDVYIFSPQNIRRYIWSHPGLHPLGNLLPIQCPKETCRALKAWHDPKVILNKNGTEELMITVKCKGCGHALSYEKPEKLKRFGKGLVLRGREGEWYSEDMTSTSHHEIQLGLE